MKTLARLAAAALLAASTARAQVAAPSLVEEDLPAADVPSPRATQDARAEPEPMIPPRWAQEPTRPAAAAARGATTETSTATATPTATGTSTSAATTTSTSTASGSATSTPASTAPPLAAPRPIEPVRATTADLRGAWTARRKALREQDVAGAEEAQQRLLALQQELGIESLRSFAATEVRDSARALEQRLEADAVAHAELAVKLDPALPEAHLAVARARLAREPTRPGPVIAALGRGAAAAVDDPYTRRAVLADLAVALAAALLAAGAAAVLVMLLRRLPLLLHDFHDLPLVRAGTPVQGALLAVALLALPVALGGGPALAVGIAVAAAWLYLETGERLVATVALLALAAAPLAAEHGARLAAFSGTAAAEVWELEHGPGDEEAARLSAAEATLPGPVLAALAGHAKRRGDLDGAQRLYDRVIEARGEAGEAGGEGAGRRADVLVNLGNVHLLRGDPDAAKAAWLDAADRAAGNLDALAAAQLNLSKLYVRQASLEQGQEARRRASQASPGLVARHAAEEDLRANRFLADVPLPPAAYRALVVADPAPAALGAAVRARVAGPLADAWPWPPLGAVAVLWLVALLGRGLRPSRACEKCGRPACARCDGATGLLCGQCVNVFVRKGVVDARDRVRKDRQVRRHARARRLATRIAALLGGGPGHLVRGEPWRGFVALALLFFAVFLAVLHRGVLPPPQPTPFAATLRLVGGVALAVVVYAGAVRDVLKRTRG